VRALDREQLARLAAEIRDFLVEGISRTGGHLSPNLGVVELTLAVHRVFESPRDAIVWDTGHQAYVHKLVTGRAAGFDTLRQPGGLSGYPSRAESEHDLVENSHASTSLSYALGIAEARLRRRVEGHVIAVIGDGALTGGMAYEALNQIAHLQPPNLLIVLNDNQRSYAPTVGGLARRWASRSVKYASRVGASAVMTAPARTTRAGPRRLTSAARRILGTSRWTQVRRGPGRPTARVGAPARRPRRRTR